MTPRRVPWVPPRPLFAIAVPLHNLLVRLWRELAPPEIAMKLAPLAKLYDSLAA